MTPIAEPIRSRTGIPSPSRFCRPSRTPTWRLRTAALAVVAALAGLVGGCNADNPVEEEGANEPIFSPDGGTFANPVDVSVTGPGGDAWVWYSVDGGPDQFFSTPLRLTRTATISAHVMRDGRAGPTATRTFIIAPTTPLPAPAMSPRGGYFDNPQTVTLSTTSMYPGTTIRFTTDTAEPLSRWAVYEKPFVLSKRSRLVAVTVADGRTNSTYAIAPFEIHTASPQIRAGDDRDTNQWIDTISYFTAAQTMTLASPTRNATIRYTTDGSEPTASSPVYEGPFQLGKSALVRAFATRSGMDTSVVASRRIEICAAPVAFAPASGSFLDSLVVSLSTATAGASIFYTLDGSEPTTRSTRYSGPITLRATTTLRAVSVKDGLSVAPAAKTSFVALPPWNRSILYGVSTDPRDGKAYRTVRIGRQRWMAENLALEGKGSCYGNSTDSCARYGRLYTWVEAMDIPTAYATSTWSGSSPRQGICPAGWHLPAVAEWDTLFAAVGRNPTALLSSTSWWRTSGLTDSVGFRGLPGGCRAGQYEEAGTFGRFWSSSSASPASATAWSLAPHSNWSIGWAKSNALSVRCVQD